MNGIGTAREVVAVVREENLPFMAASIAYYAIVSVVPLFAFALALLSLFGVADLAVDIVRAYLDGAAERALEAVLTATRGRNVAGVLGLLLSLWIAIKVFRGLTVAFAQIYGEESELSLLDQLLRSLIVFGVLLFALALLAATSLALGFLQFRIGFPTVVGNAVVFLVLVVAVLPLYYLLPPVSVTLWHALPGSVLTALGWVVLQVAFFYYARSAGSYVAYGVLGAILLFITYFYVAAIVLLIGAVVNVVRDRRTLRATSHD